MTYIYAAIAVAGAALGAFLTHLYEGGRVASVKLEYAHAQSQWDAQQASDEALARATLQKQIDDFHARDRTNESIIQDLHAKLATAERDGANARASARSLLQSAASQACGSDVPKATGQRGTANPSGTPSLNEVADACGDLAAEDAGNADAKDALIGEIKPQL